MRAELSEESLIAWLRSLASHATKQQPAAARHLIGDDTASLPRRTVITVDQQIEDVHFPAGLDPAVVARRLLAVNLSDLAASGARPTHAFLALAAPSGFDHRRFFRALVGACHDHGVALAGGDLAQSPRLHLSLTLCGERRRGDGTLARNRARSGQQLWIGGTLGESALGCELVRRGARLRGNAVELPPRFSVKGVLRAAAVRAVKRHLLPSPQLALGTWLARHGGRHCAAIDVSDGLAKDLHRLCAASAVGALLDASAIRAAGSERLDDLADRLELGSNELRESGGEDYVLLFSLPKKISPPEEFRARSIGTTTRSLAIEIENRDGTRRNLAPAGWDHLSDSRIRPDPAGAGPGGRSAHRRGS
ncbi:MAG: thiamine-phosphate kinase [Thermoanaerobaculia bacterium]